MQHPGNAHVVDERLLAQGLLKSAVAQRRAADAVAVAAMAVAVGVIVLNKRGIAA